MPLKTSRNVGESIEIGDRITVKILSVDGKTVCLEVDAPRDIPIRYVHLKGTSAQDRAPNSKSSGAECPSAMQRRVHRTLRNLT